MLALLEVPPAVQALLVVGIILVEAVVLYVGYGAVERVLTPHVVERLEDV